MPIPIKLAFTLLGLGVIGVFGGVVADTMSRINFEKFIHASMVMVGVGVLILAGVALTVLWAS